MRAKAPDRAAIRAFYDRFVAMQEHQGWYEDRAFARLIAHADFAAAERVLELGCGTGRLAEMLLGGHLKAEATYIGIDFSHAMAGFARRRLARFGPRCQIVAADVTRPLPLVDGAFDRIVATYLLEILSPADIEAVLAACRRLLRADGKLCLVALTGGVGPASRLVAWLWRLVYRLAPLCLGGCRQIDLMDDLAGWRITLDERVVARGLTSQVVIAERPAAEAV